MGDQQHRAVEALERRLERLAATRGRGGWSARRGSARWRRSGRGSPATAAAARRRTGRRPASRPPRRRTGTGRAARAPCSGVSLVARCAASSTLRGRSRAPRRAGRAAPSLTLWPRRSLPPSSSRWPGQRRDQRRLARAVGPDQRHVLAALEPQLGVAQQLALADPQLGVLDLEDHAAGALGRLEGEAERLAVARVARDALHLLQLLHPRLRLARARAGAEAGRRSARAGRSPPAGARSRGRARARAPPSPCATRARCP